jgi:hypothetical protein
MHKKLSKVIILAVIVLAFTLILNILPQKTRAGSTANVTGAAWSSNVGWISMNSKDCDLDGNGQFNGPNGCPTSGTVIDYGVNIDSAGNVSGNAWNNNIGWIGFGPSFQGPSSEPQQDAQYDSTTGKLSGWALACGGTSAGDCASGARTDGWDGWISLSSTGTNSSVTYGAKIGTTTSSWGSSSGAWGSDVTGWIDFSGVKLNIPTPVVNLSASPNNFLCTAIPAQITINWDTLNDITSCVTSSDPASPSTDWNAFTATAPTSPYHGTTNVTAPQTASSYPQIYKLECTGPGGTSGIMTATVSCTVPPPVTCTTPPLTYLDPADNTCKCPPGSTLDATTNTCLGTKTKPKFQEL